MTYGTGIMLIVIGVIGILWEGITAELEPGELFARLMFVVIGIVIIVYGYYAGTKESKRRDGLSKQEQEKLEIRDLEEEVMRELD